MPWLSCRPSSTRCTRAGGRPSIPPERLLKASLLISLYSVRSERAFCEELDYHLLFRWFLDMGLMEPSFDPTVFTKNRERLLKHEVARQFFDEVVRQADRAGAAERRALHRRRHADRSRGQPQELPTQGRATQPGIRRRHARQSEGRLPWREALERDASEHDRSRSAVGQEGSGQRSSPGVWATR